MTTELSNPEQLLSAIMSRKHKERPALSQAFVAPRNPGEELLAGMWRHLLNVERVGVEDNFFELGGHSLLATQIISQVRELFQVELPLRSLFEAPTVAALAAKIEASKRIGEGQGLPPIKPQARDGELPLSFAQERLWFLERLDPGNSAYNIQMVVRLNGSLDISALERSLSEMVRRHEVLRTSFKTSKGRPVQVIAPASPLPLPVTDLSHLTDAERDAQAQILASEDAQRPFDLEAGPLLRINLLRLRDEEHIALLSMHHIVSDGWSFNVFIRELAALYEAYREDRASPLPEPLIQYADFAYWQKQWLQGEFLHEQLSYWKEQLGGELTMLELPTERQRPAVRSFRGAKRPLALSPELSRALTKLCHREGVTLFMLLLAAFKTLLYRYTHEEEIIVGTPIANRNRAELENVIGFLVNALAIRTDMSGNPSFRQLLGRIREETLDAYAHQDLPFEQLVEELQPERDLSRAPLFQIMFALQDARAADLRLPGLELHVLDTSNGTSKFDLTLILSESDAGLSGFFEYSTDLFDEAPIARMAKHFETLLEGIAANVETRIAALPLLSEAEQQHVLFDLNRTQDDFSTSTCVHQLFEQQAERTPERVALVFAGESVTYRELNEKANRVAHYLLKNGVAGDVLLGILMERGIEMVTALLGVLKAGAAYVPLDPQYPQQRLAWMWQDAGARVLLTQSHLRNSLPTGEAKVICLEEEAAAFAGHETTNPRVEVSPDQIAYVIYTSGSTGQPKGVMIPHRALSNHMQWMARAFPLEEIDCVLQKTPFSFDASVWEFYAPLLCGARLAIAEPGKQHDPAYLVKEIEQQQVTTLQLVPSLLHMLVEEPGLQNCMSLRDVFCGGEALPASLQKRFETRHSARLHNLYGPTETCIDATYWTCRPSDEGPFVPIGHPVSNARAYVLDGQLQPVPVGVTGELYLGGEGLARGYRNRPELTAERFLPDPFSPAAGGRLYKTGDLVRRREGGELGYVGRVDQQIKFRGHRIELGEIEAVLREHAGVREAVVVLRENAAYDQRLTAYVVGEPHGGLTLDNLQSHLKQRLPEYMMPSAFVMLESLPLTSNGKLDRRALRAKAAGDALSRSNFVAPRNPSEQAMAELWVEVLGVERVGVHENFFEMGGHSLLVVQLLSRISETFQARLTLQQVFENPTVAGLSAIVSESLKGEDDSAIQRIERRSDDEQLSSLEAMSDKDVDALLTRMLAEQESE